MNGSLSYSLRDTVTCPAHSTLETMCCRHGIKLEINYFFDLLQARMDF